MSSESFASRRQFAPDFSASAETEFQMYFEQLQRNGTLEWAPLRAQTPTTKRFIKGLKSNQYLISWHCLNPKVLISSYDLGRALRLQVNRHYPRIHVLKKALKSEKQKSKIPQ